MERRRTKRTGQFPHSSGRVGPGADRLNTTQTVEHGAARTAEEQVSKPLLLRLCNPRDSMYRTTAARYVPTWTPKPPQMWIKNAMSHWRSRGICVIAGSTYLRRHGSPPFPTTKRVSHERTTRPAVSTRTGDVPIRCRQVSESRQVSEPEASVQALEDPGRTDRAA